MFRVIKFLSRPIANVTDGKLLANNIFRQFSLTTTNSSHLTNLLKHAITQGNHAVVDSLLLRGVYPNNFLLERAYKNATIMETPLHHVLSSLEDYKTKEEYNNLLKMFYSILGKTDHETLNQTSVSGNTLLHRAALLRDKNLLLTLLSNNIDANVINDHNETAEDTYVRIMEIYHQKPDSSVIEALTDAMIKSIPKNISGP